ncbi:MAG: GGDEF domain-containing protein, partial [Chitinophagaceae bacterium]|nr:GGDEF domain-containing protein [Rubrivivax sp.]
VPAVLATLKSSIGGLIQAAQFALYLYDEHGSRLYPAFVVENAQPVPAVSVDLDDASSWIARCARERRELAFEAAAGQPGLANHPSRPPGSLLLAPLLAGHRMLGVMSVQSARENVFGERERAILRTLCAYAAIGLDNANICRKLESALDALRDSQGQLVEKNVLLEQAYRQQQEASLTDPLTGLRNRRFLLQHIEADVAQVVRRRHEPSGGPDQDLVFLMIDIDHFKAVNDQHGHAAGDTVLVQMAARLKQHTRESDYLVRWGGEEFLVVARSTAAAEASVLAERLRVAISSRPFDIGLAEPLHKTCSIGFAVMPFGGADERIQRWSEVVEMADQALYLAKGEGRDRWIGFVAGDAGSAAELKSLPRGTLVAKDLAPARIVRAA